MKFKKKTFIALVYFVCYFCICQIQAQLHFEGLIYDGLGRPLLDNVSAVTTSPNGDFIFTTSYDDNAISVFSRDANTGELVFIESERNEVDNVTGIRGSYAIACDPEGKSLYVTGSLDDAVAVFSINPTTGEITYIETHKNGVEGVSGLGGAYAVTVSPDGNTVYVAGAEDDALAIFKRNVITGALEFLEMQSDGMNNVDGLSNPLSVVVSPDGKHVYTASFDDDAIATFERDPITGALSFIESQFDGSSPGVSGLIGPYSVSISPDGKNLYATGADDNALVVFSRDETTGKLTGVEVLHDDENGADGLEFATYVMVGPNGDFVYTIGADEDAIGVYSRNTTTGELSFVEVLRNGSSGVSGMNYPLTLGISPDGEHLFVPAFFGDALIIFDRNNTNGTLDFLDKKVSGDEGVDGIAGAYALDHSEDGKHIYVAGNNDNALTVLSRDIETGEMTYVEKKVDGVDGVNGLNKVYDVAVSPDGKNVYAVGHVDDALAVFSRDETTGELSFIEMQRDNFNGVNGLDGANSLVISPNGNFVFATGFWEGAIAVFKRSSTDGSLDFVEMQRDGVAGVDGLNLVTDVAISPDGKYLYATGFNDDAVAVFAISQSSGGLSFLQVLKDGINGLDGLDGTQGLAMSPDGETVYVTSLFDAAVSVFSRNEDTGLLSYIQLMQGVEGLNGIRDVTVSPDGLHVYTSSTDDNTVNAYQRKPDGTLIYEISQTDGLDNVNGLDRAQSIDVSPDGRFIYTTGTLDDAVAFFSCTYVIDMDQTICRGDSVIVGTSVYKQSGSYRDTFINTSCKNIVSLNLTVLPGEVSDEAEICTGGTYMFGNQALTQQGTYTEVFTNSIGCDSTVTLTLKVSDVLESDLEQSICEGEAYTLNNVDYMQSGIFTERFLTAAGCDSVVTLNLTVHDVVNTVENVSICRGDFYVFGTSNYLESGSYSQNYISRNGCDSIATLNLVVNDPEVVNEIEATICSGESFQVGNASYNTSGFYGATLTSAGGCDSVVSVQLNVLPAIAQTQNSTICEGEELMIGTTSYTESGIYTTAIPAANGCDSTITLNLTVQPAVFDRVETICEGETYMIGNTAFTSTGFYTETLANANGCDSTINLNLTVEETSSTITQQICQGSSYSFAGNNYTTSGTYTDNQVTAAGCPKMVTLNLSVVDQIESEITETICAGESFYIGTTAHTESGVYMENLTAAGGCDSMVTLNLTVTADPVIEETITIDDGTGSGSISLNLTNEVTDIMWSTGETTSSISNLEVGTYTAEITYGNGCVITKTYEVVDQTTSIFNLDKQSFSTLVYPNPGRCSKSTTIEFDSNLNQVIKISVFDNVGKVLSTNTINALEGESIHHIENPKNAGIYFIQMTTESGEIITQRLSIF